MKIKNIIQKIKTKDGKVLVGNFLSLSTLQLAGMILPLFTLPYLIKILGFKNYGILAIANSLVAYFSSVTDYSFNITATRDVSKHRNSLKQLNLIYSKVMMVQGMFLLLSLLSIYLIVISYEPFRKHSDIFFIVATGLIGNVLIPQWFFQGIEKMKFIAIISLIVKVLFTASIFIFIKTKNDLDIYAWLISSGSIISGLIGQLILYVRFKINFILLPFKHIIQTIKSNFPVFVNQIFPLMYNNTSTFLLGFFVAENLTGIYAALKKITDLSTTLLKTISRVFFPFLNRRVEAFGNYRKLMLWTTGVGLLLLIALYPLVFMFLSIKDESAIYVHVFLCLSLVGFVLYDIYGLNYLIVHRKDKIVMKNTIFTSVTGFILAFPLIYYFGIIGAAVNLFIARLLMGLGVMLRSRNVS